jgi:hypothetical protein
MKKVIDMSKIKVGDVIETFNDSREFLILSKVDHVDKDKSEIYVNIEEYAAKIYLKDIFSHYTMVTK